LKEILFFKSFVDKDDLTILRCIKIHVYYCVKNSSIAASASSRPLSKTKRKHFLTPESLALQSKAKCVKPNFKEVLRISISN